MAFSRSNQLTRSGFSGSGETEQIEFKIEKHEHHHHMEDNTQILGRGRIVELEQTTHLKVKSFLCLLGL